MAHEDLIDARVSIGQCKKAVDALHTHEFNKEQKLQESELLPGKEPNIWLNVTVKKMPSSHNFKPAKMYVKSQSCASRIDHQFQSYRTPISRSANDTDMSYHQGPSTRIQGPSGDTQN